jgi:hypothetical protein
MRCNKLSLGLRVALAIFALTFFVTSAWAAPQEKVLHSFGRGTDGYLLNAGLIFDAAGNLYGTTVTGGIHSCGDLGCGTVFEIVP